MDIRQQFSVFMVNKPGILAQVLNEIADAKINIMALTMMDSVEHGVMRIVSKQDEKLEEVLRKLNMQYSKSEVLCVTLSNHSGALADVTEILAREHINISYAYCTAGAKGGKTTGVLKVADVKKAIKVLQKKGGKKVSKDTKGVRRSPASRR
jgi:hypothetical protein